MLGSSIGSAAGGILGSILLPGIGTAAGTTVGGILGGLFDSPAEVPGYRDQTDPRLSASAARLRKQKLGAQMAARERVNNQRSAQKQIENYENDPNASRSGAFRSGVYNSAFGAAEERNIGAALQGANIDQSAEERASNIDLQNQNLSMQRNQFDRQGFAMGQNASPTDAALTGAFGLAAGNLLSGGLNKTDTTTTDTTMFNRPEFTHDYTKDVPTYGIPSLTQGESPLTDDFIPPHPSVEDLGSVESDYQPMFPPSRTLLNYGGGGYNGNSQGLFQDYQSRQPRYYSGAGSY